jgi:WD domain, G-beta repeat
VEWSGVSELVRFTLLRVWVCACVNPLLTSTPLPTSQSWNPHTLELLDTLCGHEDSVMSLAADSTYLFSGSQDGTIRVCFPVLYVYYEYIYVYIYECGCVYNAVLYCTRECVIRSITTKLQ